MEREINKLADDKYDDRAKNFIENKWLTKRDYLSKHKAAVVANRGLFKAADTFKEFLCDNQDAQKGITEVILNERVKNLPDRDRRRLADKILMKPRKCPMITTLIKSNLFLNFKVLKFGGCSHDTLDDLKHLINASYADIFVTEDKNLLSYTSDINPDVEVKICDEFLLF